MVLTEKQALAVMGAVSALANECAHSTARELLEAFVDDAALVERALRLERDGYWRDAVPLLVGAQR